jgi:purine-binding chemotaxis protein CheW
MQATLTAQQDHDQYLTFVLGRETFAIGILGIKEILEYEEPTDVPMMPPYIRGVVNLRGSVVPVIDLGARFGKGSTPVTKKTCIVIVETAVNAHPQVLGIVVDAVNEVMEISQSAIEPPPSFGVSVRTDFIAGMGKVREKFVILLDLDRILTVDDLAVLAAPVEVAEPATAVEA